MSEFVKWFKEIAKNNIALLEGKSKLGKMYQQDSLFLTGS